MERWWFFCVNLSKLSNIVLPRMFTWFHFVVISFWLLGPLLLTWNNDNTSIDKKPHAQESIGWNYFSIPKRQRLHRLSLGMDSNFISSFIMDVITYPWWDTTDFVNDGRAKLIRSAILSVRAIIRNPNWLNDITNHYAAILTTLVFSSILAVHHDKISWKIYRYRRPFLRIIHHTVNDNCDYLTIFNFLIVHNRSN